ncbi:hypothetical protein ACX80E_08730 [Arthrobacter sp. TMN-49]
MSQQHPAAPPQSPERNAIAEAYRQGYLQGHRAGWGDALAARAQTAPAGPHSQQGRAPASVMAAPVTFADVGPAPAPMAPQHPVPVAPTWAVPVPLMSGAQPTPMPTPVNYGRPPAMPTMEPAHYRVPVQAPGAVDPAALAAKKNKRELQNINVTLYVASLLMVAAAALFVGSTLPVVARLVGVWLGTALFYTAGLVLHSKVTRLKPAAVAFTGTALAIIPFAGLATYNLGLPAASTVWLTTSLIGTVAYIFAAVRLQSRLVAYLSLAFLLSTAWSSVAALGAALAWYFTALIVFAALLSLAGYLLKRGAAGEGTEPSIYAKPLNDLGPWFAPAGLLGSLIFSLALNAADHALVLIAGVMYYSVMTLICAPALKRYNYLGLRLSLTMAAPFVGWMIAPNLAWAVGSFTVVLAVQLITVAYTQVPLARFLDSGRWVRWDVFISIPVMSAAAMLWSIGLYWQPMEAAGSTSLAVLGVAFGLVVAMVTVPAFLPHGEWLPLPALGAILLFSPLLEAAGWSVLLLVAVLYTVVRYLTTKGTALRAAMLVTARLCLTALVASSMATFVPAQPGKVELIVAVIAIIAAGQLFADALIGKLGKVSAVISFSAAAWALVGTVLVVGLSLSHSWQDFTGNPAREVLAATRWEFLVAAIAMAAAAVAYSLLRLPRTGGLSSAELVAPSYLSITALCAGAVFDAAGASVGWAVSTAFLTAAGLLLASHSESLHRWLYWWAARLSSLLLAVALFQLWAEADPATLIAGQPVNLGLVILLALVPQLLILAATHWRGKTITGLQMDVGITLLLLVSVAVLSGIGNHNGNWATFATVGLSAVALATLGIAGALRAAWPAVVQWAAPAAMLLLALSCAGNNDALVLVLAIVVATSGLLSLKTGTYVLRGVHFMVARLAFTALVGVVVGQLVDNPAVTSLALTAALLLQVSVQYFASRTKAVVVVGEPVLLRISLWLLQGGQVLVPVAYHLLTGGFAAPGTALRWVAVVELVALALTAIAAQLFLSQRGASYLALVAAVGGAAVIGPVLWPGATALILLAICVGIIAWRCLYTPTEPEMRWYWLVATSVFLLAACVVDSGAATGIFAAMWLVAGLAFIVAAHVMQLPWLTLPGALLIFLSATMFSIQVFDLTHLRGVSAFAGFVVVVGTLYLVRLVLLDLLEAPYVQRWSVVAVALGGGAFFSLMTMMDRKSVLLGAGTFTLIALLACLEAPATIRRRCVDGAVVACALVWFVACSSYVDLGLFWFVQWCAVALGALALIRYVASQEKTGKALLLAAACLASFGALLTVFSGDTLTQLISLLIFVALLAVGMSLNERLFTIWGAIGVTTAVVWYVRGYTFILLAVLALALIAFAIWGLTRKKPLDEVPVPAYSPGPPQ